MKEKTLQECFVEGRPSEETLTENMFEEYLKYKCFEKIKSEDDEFKLKRVQ